MSEFTHCSINHSTEFVRNHTLINGIENFWSQVKRHLRKKYNEILKTSKNLFSSCCYFTQRPEQKDAL